MSKWLSAVMVMTGVLGGVTAQAKPPAAISQYLDRHASAFVQDPGRKIIDTSELEGDKYYSRQRFPDQSGMFMPDSTLDAITKSILVVESVEVPLPRVRYLVSYNFLSSPDDPDFSQQLVEVTRFNLGPVVRQDLAAYVPADRLAPAKTFGVGPHVSWRFALGDVMGGLAVLQASRGEITDAQASKIKCLGQKCLSLEDSQGPSGAWKKPTLYGSIPDAVYTSKNKDGLPIPARVAEVLFAYATPEGVQAIPFNPNKPRFIVVLSQNVQGQEASSAGLLYESNVMDDEIGTAWIRFNQAAGMKSPDLQQLFVKRKR
ncbi:hypothetical protein H0A58_08815 [Alcaligenaceae bacterium]|nr:hypothetical protein [Alcaligenaceae bacterium]